MGRAFRHRLRVRYSECDMQGVVFNANYLTYFDTAVTELWREAIGAWSELTELPQPDRDALIHTAGARAPAAPPAEPSGPHHPAHRTC